MIHRRAIDEVVLVDVISALSDINGALGERYQAIFEALLPSFTQAVLVSEGQILRDD